MATELTKRNEVTEMIREENRIAEAVIGAAIEVHRHLGPGLLESAYRRALAHELKLRPIAFEAQKACPLDYKGIDLQEVYRLDLLVGGKVVVEIKSVDALADVHESQVLTSLKFTNCRIGLLIDFRTKLLKDGIRRLAL